MWKLLRGRASETEPQDMLKGVGEVGDAHVHGASQLLWEETRKVPTNETSL